MNEGLLEGVGSGQAGTRGRFAYTYLTTSQTVNGPAWARYVSILVVAGGAGGGGGRLSTSTGASGGAGGSGGSSIYRYRIPMFSAPAWNMKRFIVTIGAGGTGGAGATVDPNNGTSGTNAGNSTVTFNYPNDTATPRASLVLGPNGSTGGQGGQTAVAQGFQGGNVAGGQRGSYAGSGTTTVAAYPGVSASDYYTPIPYIVMGGCGATGKNSQSGLVYPPPWNIAPYASGTSANIGFSVNGQDAQLEGQKWFDLGLKSLRRAPISEELWFISICGGMPGTGADTSTANAAGNGGKGWNGTGGGGGGGAGGTAGSKGGNGGNGGDGYALFFWEEY